MDTPSFSSSTCDLLSSPVDFTIQVPARAAYISHCLPPSPRHRALFISHKVLTIEEPLLWSTHIHPPDPAVFSRGKSDLVTAAPHFSAQSPYMGFHCSVVQVYNHVAASSSTCPFGLTHTSQSPELSSKADPHLSPLSTFCSLWWTVFLPLVPG